MRSGEVNSPESRSRLFLPWGADVSDADLCGRALLLWAGESSDLQPHSRCLPEGQWLSGKSSRIFHLSLSAPVLPVLSSRAHILPHCPDPSPEVLFEPTRQVSGQGLSQRRQAVVEIQSYYFTLRY